MENRFSLYMVIVLLYTQTIYAKKNEIFNAEQWHSTQNVVYDTKMDLMWEDTEESLLGNKTWDNAVKYCSNLALDGYQDWKVPTYGELLSLINYEHYDPAIVKTFQNVNTSSNYWALTEYIEDNKSAWIVYFYNGYTYFDSKTTHNSVRCVRKDKGL